MFFHSKLVGRIAKLESKIEDLRRAVYIYYYPDWASWPREVLASKVIEKLIEHLNLELDYKFHQEEDIILNSTVPVKKPKGKVKKKK